MDILDYNPITGEKVTFQYNHENDTFTIGHEQDCQPVLDANKRRLLESDSKLQVKKGWLKYASIPNIVILKWKREHNVDFFNDEDWPKVMGLLNSREYRYLKTTELTHDR